MKKIIRSGIIVSLVIGIFCYMMLSVFAEVDLTAAEQEKQNADNQMLAAQQNQEYLQSEINRISQQKASLVETQYVTELQLENKMTEAEKLQHDIDDLARSSAQSQADFNSKQNQLKLRLKSMYMNSNSTANIRIFLESQSINDMLQRYHFMKKLYDADRKLMKDFIAAKADFELKKSMTENTKTQTLAAADQAKTDIAQLSASTANAEYNIALSEQSLAYWKQKEAEFLQESLAWMKIILQAQNPNSHYSDGIMEWPVPGYGFITQYFGYYPSPIFGYVTLHDAIDIGAPSGANIVAANSGTILFSGWQNGYGNCVVIDHGGGISTLYAHASLLNCVAGQIVDRGQTIAFVGSTGWSTGPHLHFEVRVNGEKVNPQNYVSY